MRVLIAFLIATLLSSPLCFADALVWKVSKGKQNLYLGGSIHLLRPSDFPLRPEYDFAFNKASVIGFETDVAQLMSLDAQQKIMQAMMLPAGKTLKSSVSPAVYGKLEQQAQRSGIPMMALNMFKPTMAVLSILQLELQKMGASTDSGVEAHYSKRAKLAGKRTVALETLDNHIGILSTLGEGYEDAFILQSLEDLKIITTEYAKIVAAWKSGDENKLNKDLVERMRVEAPEMYRALLVDRNRDWANKVDIYIKSPEVEFLLVGAAHLIGRDSLLKMLQKKGYKIEKVRLKK